jgi:tripartite-type tricarboxylate transporter receptor subunit TctC
MITLHIPCRLLPLLIGAALCSAAAYGQVAGLQNRPIRIIVPNAPGGPNDLAGRIIAPQLSEALRQNVVVDNRASANGVIGAEYVAHGEPDGTVLAVGNSGTHAVNFSLYKKPTYDPVRDFAAVSEIMFSSLVFVANPGIAANNVTELIAEARRNPGKLNIAVAGATGEIAGNLIKLQGKIEMNNVPYKGGSPAIIAVISNESQLLLTPYAALAAMIDAGKLKAIGVTGSKRDRGLPNVPTLAESGLEGYQVEFWVGFFAPAKTPAATVRALAREIVRITNTPEVKDRLVAGGYEVVGSTPEQFTERVKRDTAKYRKIVLDSGMQQLE